MTKRHSGAVDSGDGDELLNAEALATFLGCSIRSIARYRQSGLIPEPRRIGRGLARWLKSEVIRFIAAL